jgi:hypothetical protein
MIFLALLGASLAAPIPPLGKAVQSAQRYLTKAQEEAIESAVRRKYKKKGLDSVEDRVIRPIYYLRQARTLKARQFDAKIAKESAAEQKELQEAAKNGGFWGLVKRANTKTTSKPQRLAVLPETDLLKGRRLFDDNQIAAFRASSALEQINSDGTRLIKTRLGGKEKILVISDVSLGGGSFGETFIAQDVATKELIAFKILKHESKFQDISILKDYSDISSEIRAWRSQSMLETEIVELGDGRKGFGMKLLKGQTLWKEMMGAQSMDELRDAFERGIVAIKKMHEGGMAHGDLHSANILTGGQVVDWGATRPFNAMSLYGDYFRFISVLIERDGWLPPTFQKQFRAELALWQAELIKAFDANKQQKWLKKLED